MAPRRKLAPLSLFTVCLSSCSGLLNTYNEWTPGHRDEQDTVFCPPQHLGK